MELEILNPSKSNSFDVQIGERTTDLLDRINIPEDELEILKNEMESEIRKC